MLNCLQANLQAVCPGSLSITGEADNLWFLSLLACREDLRKIARLAQEHPVEPGGGGRQVRLGDSGVAATGGLFRGGAVGGTHDRGRCATHIGVQARNQSIR
jgi:hypothetical protein